MLALLSSVSCELPSLAGRDRRVTTRHRLGLGRERNTEVPLALVEQQKPRTRIRWKIRNNKFIKEKETQKVIFLTENFRARQKNPKKRIYLNRKDFTKFDKNNNVFTLIETPRIISKDDLKDNEFPSPGDNSLPPEHVLVARGGRNYPLLLTKPRTRLVRLKHRPRRVNRKRVKKDLLQTEISKNQIESLFANKELVRGLTFSPILSPQVQFLKSQLQKPHVPEESQDTIILPREIFAGHPADDFNINTGTFSLAVGL